MKITIPLPLPLALIPQAPLGNGLGGVGDLVSEATIDDGQAAKLTMALLVGLALNDVLYLR